MNIGGNLKMKKCVKSVCCMAFVIMLALMFLTGCNKQIVDLTYKFDYAIISLPNGEIVEGKVQSWKDYEDGDQIQVKVSDTTYLVHAANVALIGGYNG